MPYLNSKGQIASGVASGIVAVDRTQIDTGGGTRWVDDDTLIYQRTPSNMVVITAPDHHNVQSLDRGANEIAAGGGHWATWLAGDGLRHSRGGYLANAGLKDVGTDGTLALVPNRQVGVGLNFIALQDDFSTRRFFSLDVVANDVSVLRWGCAIWRNERNETWALLEGQKVLVPTVGPAFRPRLLQVDGEWWVAYNTNESPVGRTLLHPVTEPVGYELAVGDAQFGLDAIAFNGGVLLTWATTEGEAPGDIVRAEFAMNGHLTRTTATSTSSQILEYRTVTKAATPPPTKPPVTPPVEPPKEPTHMENVFEFIDAHPMKAILGTPKGAGLDNARAFNSLRFVNAVATDLNERDGAVNWGLEKDTSGDHMPVINGQGYWADGLRTRTEGIDIVANSENETAVPVWGDVGPAEENGPRGFREPFTDAEIVAAATAQGLDLGTGAVQPPTKPPVTPPPNASLEARVAALEKLIAAHESELDNHASILESQDAELSEHAELLDALMNDPTKSPTTPPAEGGATEATLLKVQALLAEIVTAINSVLPGRKAA